MQTLWLVTDDDQLLFVKKGTEMSGFLRIKNKELNLNTDYFLLFLLLENKNLSTMLQDNNTFLFLNLVCFCPIGGTFLVCATLILMLFFRNVGCFRDRNLIDTSLSRRHSV